MPTTLPGRPNEWRVYLANTVRKTLGGALGKKKRAQVCCGPGGFASKAKKLALGAILVAWAGIGCATKSAQAPSEEVSTPRSNQPSLPQAKRPFLVAAFSWLPKLSFHRPKPPQAQVPRLIGVIKMVDEDDRFVLIDATTFQGAAPGDLLICIREQKETANLRMSNLQNPPFLIADVASGRPAPGDRVVKP